MALPVIFLDPQALRQPEGGAGYNLSLTAISLPISGAPQIRTPILPLEGWGGGSLIISFGIRTPADTAGAALTLTAEVRAQNTGDADSRAFDGAVSVTHTRVEAATELEFPTLTLTTADLDGITSGGAVQRIQVRVGRSATGNTAIGAVDLYGIEIREA